MKSERLVQHGPAGPGQVRPGRAGGAPRRDIFRAAVVGPVTSLRAVRAEQVGELGTHRRQVVGKSVAVIAARASAGADTGITR